MWGKFKNAISQAERNQGNFRRRSGKVILVLITILMVMVWTPVLYARSLNCLPIKNMSIQMMQQNYAYTSTFTSMDDIVFQLYVARDGRWKIAWVKPYGDKSCELFSGYEWNWAMPSI